MIAPGMVLVFLGYSLGSWGFCLVKGWNIPLRSWMSPTNPWQWPAGDVPTVPPGQIMPGQPAGGMNQAGPVTQQIGNVANQAAGAGASLPQPDIGQLVTGLGQNVQQWGQ